MSIRSLLVRGGAAAPPPTFNLAQFQNVIAPGDGGGSFEVAWTLNDAVGGEYVDVAWAVTAGDPITTVTSGNNNGNTSSPASITTSLGSNAFAEATLSLYSAGATLLDTYVLSNQLIS